MKKQLLCSDTFSGIISRCVKVLFVIIMIFSMLGFQSPQTLAATPTSRISSDRAASINFLGDLGTVIDKSSAMEIVINTSMAVSTGNDIIVALGTDPNSNMTVTVTDSAGNTYQEEALEVNVGNIRTYLFAAYDVNAMPIGSEITISMSVGVTAHAAVAALFDGLADVDTLDQMASENDTSTSPSSGVTSATTQADELLIGVVGTEGSADDSAGTWGDSFLAGPRAGTTGGADDENITISMGYRIVDATGSYTASKSGITSRDWAAIIGTFKADLVENKPLIVINGTLEEFHSPPGNVSGEQSYTVSGINLTEDITISAPENFEISLSSGSGFTEELVLTQSGGIVTETPIYVHFSMAAEGTSSGVITHSSSGANTRSVPVSGSSEPLNPVDFNILLACPEDDSITMNIIPDNDVVFYVEYGIVSGTYTDQTIDYDGFEDEVIEFTIDDLTGNTRYYYHLVYHQTGITEWNNGAEHSFITQRSPGESFVFTIQSDSHLGQYGGQSADEYDLYALTLQTMAADQPDFLVDLGDTYAMDPSPLGSGMNPEEAMAAYYVQRPFLGEITHSIPFFQVIGNHENEEGWNFDDVFEPDPDDEDDPYSPGDMSLALVGMAARKYYIPVPIPDDFYSGNTDLFSEPIGDNAYHEDYYAWEWGDALFVVLDPYHYSMTWPSEGGDGYGGEGQDGEVAGDRWDWSLGIEQYLWFKDTLENSSAKYKFIFSHHVTGGATQYGRGGQLAADYFEWGGKNADGSWGWDTERPASEGWTVPVHQLMVNNDVDIFFHGHDHIYAYEEVDGIAYVEVAKPDDAGYTWEPYGYGYNEDLYPDAISIIPNSGYMRVTVTPEDDVFVEYVRTYLPGDGSNGIVDHDFTVPLAGQVGILGDVDGDGVASSTDALIILSGDVGMDISPYCPINCGDVDGSGSVNSTDALVILSFDVGMSVPYDIEQPGCPFDVTPPPGCTP